LATNDGLEFAEVLKAQVKELRDQVKAHPRSSHILETSRGSVRYESLGVIATTREPMQCLGGREMPRGLSATAIMPSTNTVIRHWN